MFLAPYGSLLASFRSQIDPPNFIWTDPHQFSTKSDHCMTFSTFRPGTPRYLLPGPPLSSSAAIYSESGFTPSIKYQYGPTGSVDREFVDIVREREREREKEKEKERNENEKKRVGKKK